MDPSEWHDTDQDGVGDKKDAYPLDGTKWHKGATPESSTMASSETTTTSSAASVETEFTPGTYKLLQQAGALPTAKWGNSFSHILRTGTLVHVLEVKNVVEESTIRGKIESGGWISIKNTKTGHAWAMPWAVSPADSSSSSLMSIDKAPLAGRQVESQPNTDAVQVPIDKDAFPIA